jgi:hypothetical protein
LADEVERALQANLPRHNEPLPVWADGPSARDEEPRVTPRADVLGHYDDSDDDLSEADDEFTPDGTESLGDWLAAARVCAESAVDADKRSRAALYQALSRAYDFALEADTNAEDYAELLADSGIAVQERAPMTPIVKLVFGIDHDKTRLAEYALVLGHAKRTGMAKGEILPLVKNLSCCLRGGSMPIMSRCLARLIMMKR